MEKILEEHACVVDRDKGKLRLRVWPKNRGTEGNQEFTIKLTNEERLELIHMLSKSS